MKITPKYSSATRVSSSLHPTLKILALEELQATLACFTLYDERTGDIVELRRYVYVNIDKRAEGVEVCLPC